MVGPPKNRLPMSQRKSDLGIPLPYTWLNPSTRPRFELSDHRGNKSFEELHEHPDIDDMFYMARSSQSV
jgi:hypothetical protein